MYCLGAWNRVMITVILDDLIAFTYILRIFEGSALVFLNVRNRLHWFHLSKIRMKTKCPSKPEIYSINEIHHPSVMCA